MIEKHLTVPFVSLQTLRGNLQETKRCGIFSEKCPQFYTLLEATAETAAIGDDAVLHESAIKTNQLQRPGLIVCPVVKCISSRKTGSTNCDELVGCFMTVFVDMELGNNNGKIRNFPEH